MLKRVWRKWMAVGHFLGNLQARIFLTLFYGIGVMPFAIAVRLLADPLRIKRRQALSWWVVRPPQDAGIDQGKRQY